MARCDGCAREVDDRFRFCPWCARPHRAKLVEFFPAHGGIPQEASKALRVSRYLRDDEHGAHVRFSVWDADGVAEGVVSLSAAEAARLARFLLDAPSGDDAPTLVQERPETA
jgi:hypothetical protein